jgi:hypothetical protein
MRDVLTRRSAAERVRAPGMNPELRTFIDPVTVPALSRAVMNTHLLPVRLIGAGSVEGGSGLKAEGDQRRRHSG